MTITDLAESLAYELQVDGADVDTFQVLDALAVAGLTLTKDETNEASDAFIAGLGG